MDVGSVLLFATKNITDPPGARPCLANYCGLHALCCADGGVAWARGMAMMGMGVDMGIRLGGLRGRAGWIRTG